MSIEHVSRTSLLDNTELNLTYDHVVIGAAGAAFGQFSLVEDQVMDFCLDF